MQCCQGSDVRFDVELDVILSSLGSSCWVGRQGLGRGGGLGVGKHAIKNEVTKTFFEERNDGAKTFCPKMVGQW